jgi:polysaccharide biosynthesis/export protein
MKDAPSTLSRLLRHGLPLALLLALSACYRPGRFIWVDDYRVPPSLQDEGYTIRKGDILNVNVWNQREISSRARVRDDGRISLPLLNDVDAAGHTPPALARALEVKLKDLVNHPVVTVMVEEIQPVKVAVLGEVKDPGMKQLEPGSGLLQALAVASGFTDYARDDAIYVLRREPGAPNPTRIRFTYAALARGEGSTSTFRLRTGDVVVVE